MIVSEISTDRKCIANRDRINDKLHRYRLMYNGIQYDIEGNFAYYLFTDLLYGGSFPVKDIRELPQKLREIRASFNN